ncbi:MAG: hypothetical protein QMC78_03010 [Methanocellales archaeon]|nr:hypothetical protein [Methanocellales archaeon]
MSLSELAKEHIDHIMRPYGHTDVLLFYGVVAPKLRKFLDKKEIASKVWLPSGKIKYFLKRGSKEKPLYIAELIDSVTPELLEVRSEKKLSDARGPLTPEQENVWTYFPPRKLSDFFYATNSERANRPIERIFFDIDRGEGVSAKDAQEVTKAFVEVIQDEELSFTSPLWVCWTGASFHVYLFLKKEMPPTFYEKHFKFTKDSMSTFTEKWVAEVGKNVAVKVKGGHEKSANAINIDSSQTPSGKLCRVPFSLHMKDARTVDGVSIPLELKMLNEPGLISDLTSYSPERVIKELDELARRLPEKFR